MSYSPRQMPFSAGLVARQLRRYNMVSGMVESKYNGQHIKFRKGHPHEGETGVIIGRAHTIAGDGWVVRLDDKTTAEECFFFGQTDVEFID
jgi:hypothetical protein